MSCWAQAIYERLEELDPTTFETDAIKLLTGLGFTQKMMAKCTKVRAHPSQQSSSLPPSDISVSIHMMLNITHIK